MSILKLIFFILLYKLYLAVKRKVQNKTKQQEISLVSGQPQAPLPV